MAAVPAHGLMRNRAEKKKTKTLMPVEGVPHSQRERTRIVASFRQTLGSVCARFFFYLFVSHPLIGSSPGDGE